MIELGDLGLDEGAHLLIERALKHAAVVSVRGTSPNLAFDLPAWCRAKGHAIEKLVGVEHFGARFGRLILGLDGFSMLSSSGRILPRCVDLRIGDINGSYLGVCY